MLILDRKCLHLVIKKKPKTQPRLDRIAHRAKHHTQVQPAAHCCLSCRKNMGSLVILGTLKVVLWPVIKSTIPWQFSSEQGTRKQNTSSNSNQGGGREGREGHINTWVTSHPHTGVLYDVCFMNSSAYKRQICNHWQLQIFCSVSEKRSTYFNWEALAPVALPLLCLCSHTDQAFPSYLRSDENWSSCCEASLQNKTLEQFFIPNGVITYETRRAGEK